jgi:hypothetical protein
MVMVKIWLVKMGIQSLQSKCLGVGNLAKEECKT